MSVMTFWASSSCVAPSVSDRAGVVIDLSSNSGRSESKKFWTVRFEAIIWAVIMEKRADVGDSR